MAELTSKRYSTAIVWFRRDLRVDDNPALVAALHAATNVIPVFIWAAEEEGQFQPGRCTRWWTKHSLTDLQQALAALGSRLVVRRSTDSTAALLAVVKEVGAEAVFFNHLYDPISLMRDHDCKRGLTAAGVAAHTFNGDMLYEPWEVLDEHGQPLSTFQDFWNRVRTMPVPPPFPVSAPASMPPVPPAVHSLAVNEVDWFFTPEQEMSSEQLKFKWKPGVGGAISELEYFLADRLAMFEHDRAKVDRDSTSRLSPWIHIGSISVRYIFYRVKQCQAEWAAAGTDRTLSCDDFLQQMGYREYSRYLAFHFPFIHERSLLRHLRACPWRIDQVAFKAWRQGQTGYPLVDAAMRQLWSSGWCHNRARVVAASFLVKDLLLPWQWGLKYYWEAQIDADLECDALGWQYVSGGMSDAHPFSYMIDLETEAKRFDADGEYVRRWLPVLSRLPTEYIHAPWKAPPQVLAAADVELGNNYPLPIISRADAKANVAYACSVLDKSTVALPAESSGRNPYRAPTYPQPQPHMAAGAGTSSGANPTGTGGNTAGAAGGAGSNPDAARPHAAQQVVKGAGPGSQWPQPDSRTGSVANGGSSGRPSAGFAAQSPNAPSAAAGGGGAAGGSAPVSQAAAGQQHQQHNAWAQQSGGKAPGSGAGPSDSGGAAATATATATGGMPRGAAAAMPAPGGGVFYHPGDAAASQVLEKILHQQRAARGPPRHPDGSGTNNPPAGGSHALHPQPGGGAAAAAAAAGGADAGAVAAALMHAGRERAAEAADAEEEDFGEGGALWRSGPQHGLPMGTAAFAFEQAMQLLLARRRIVDGVSAIDGDLDDQERRHALMGDDADSEEVVSNTVDLNITTFTGQSGHHHRGAGTARGAKRMGRRQARSAAAGEGEDLEEGVGSPSGSDKDAPDHKHQRREGGGHHHHGGGDAAMEHEQQEEEQEEEYMEEGEEQEAHGLEEGGGGTRTPADAGGASPRAGGCGEGDDCGDDAQVPDDECMMGVDREGEGEGEGQGRERRLTEAESGGSVEPLAQQRHPHQHPQHAQQHAAAAEQQRAALRPHIAAEPAGVLPGGAWFGGAGAVDAAAAAGGGGAVGLMEVEVVDHPGLEEGGGGAGAVDVDGSAHHKRRRSASGDLDWE